MLSAVLTDKPAAISRSATATSPTQQPEESESSLEVAILESCLVGLPLADAVREFLVVATGALLSQSLCVYKHMMSALRRPASPQDGVASSPQTMKATISSKRSKLNRSISSSSVPESSISSSWPGPRAGGYFTRSMAERCRTISTMEDSIKRRHVPMEVEYSSVAQAKLYMKAGKFPFRELNKDCKLKVFSYLNLRDLGVAAQVCREWHALLCVPSVWHTVDINEFPMCRRGNSKNHQCSKLCYVEFRARIQAFHRHLIDLRPILRRWSWSFDIADYDDDYLPLLMELLRNARLHDLREVHMNWTDTPQKPFLDVHTTWTTSDYNNFNQRHRSRVRKFLPLLDMLTAGAGQLRVLQTPWPWSNRGAVYLRRLQQLHTLKLQKYSVFETLTQDSLDLLLDAVPSLKCLVLEVWSPSARGMALFSLSAPALRTLDISQSRGFYLCSMNLPSLEEFYVGRHPWNGPLVASSEMQLPCIYDILSAGAPNLRQLNEHELAPDWAELGAEYLYPELERVLHSVCSCRRHKAGWAM